MCRKLGKCAADQKQREQDNIATIRFNHKFIFIYRRDVMQKNVSLSVSRACVIDSRLEGKSEGGLSTS